MENLHRREAPFRTKNKVTEEEGTDLEDQTCCPRFDPKPWDEKTHEWSEKPFLTATMPVLFHMPFPWLINKTLTRLWETAQKYGIASEMKDFLLLAHDPSPWKSRYYLAVAGTHPDLEKDIVRLSGTFVSKVFDGPYNAVPKCMRETEEWLRKAGKTPKEHYFYFTTCPKCARIYGHNYMVDFARI